MKTVNAFELADVLVDKVVKVNTSSHGWIKVFEAIEDEDAVTFWGIGLMNGHEDDNVEIKVPWNEVKTTTFQMAGLKERVWLS